MAVFSGSPVSVHGVAHTPLEADDIAGYGRAARPFSYTHAAGTGTGEINLCRLPAGSWTIIAAESAVACAQLGAGATLALGVRVTSEAAEDAAALLAATDVASGAVALTDLATLGSSDAAVVSTDPITIFATIASGTISNAKVISGVIVFRRT